MKTIYSKLAGLAVVLLMTQTACAFYCPSTGCWPNRDPLGERGGINLNTMIINNPVDLIDLLGLRLGPLPAGTIGFKPPPISPGFPPVLDNPGGEATSQGEGLAGVGDIAGTLFDLANNSIDYQKALAKCAEQARKNGTHCLGCCLINIFKLQRKSGMFEDPRTKYLSQYFDEDCPTAENQMLIDWSQPDQLEAYYGDYGPRSLFYRLTHPYDRSQVPLDKQTRFFKFIPISLINNH